MEELTTTQLHNGLQIFDKTDGKLLTHLNSCVHCGLCAESCIYYLTNRQAKFIPAYKVDLVSSVYRRYCTFTGKVFPALTGARTLDKATTDELVDQLLWCLHHVREVRKALLDRC